MGFLVSLVGVSFSAAAQAPNTESIPQWSSVYLVAYNSPTTPYKPLQRYEPIGNGQCVALVQAHGFEGFRGNAYQWKKYINSDIGWVGYAVLLDEGPYQHLALIVGTDGGYNLVEQNYEGRYIVSERTIPFTYERIVGFIRP